MQRIVDVTNFFLGPLKFDISRVNYNCNEKLTKLSFIELKILYEQKYVYLRHDNIGNACFYFQMLILDFLVHILPILFPITLHPLTHHVNISVSFLLKFIAMQLPYDLVHVLMIFDVAVISILYKFIFTYTWVFVKVKHQFWNPSDLFTFRFIWIGFRPVYPPFTAAYLNRFCVSYNIIIINIITSNIRIAPSSSRLIFNRK